MARQRALVTPEVLRWARTKAGYDIATAAKKIHRPPSEITAWEEGSLRPTLAQARKAAHVYKRPLAVLYLPEPPKDFGTLRDFRHLPKGISRSHSPELALLIRQVHIRQEWLREFLISEGAGRLSFVGSATVNDSPADVAKSIRGELGVSPDQQIACRSRRQALVLWIERAEARGVSVCREGKVQPKEARGFLLADPYAPFIYVNSSDAEVAQLFTLVHELAHLWLGEPGISNREGLAAHSRGPHDAIEVLCNRVAAGALLDAESFAEHWQLTALGDPLQRRIEQVSAKFKVSEEAVARRLLDRGAISAEKYQELRNYYNARWRAYAKRPRSSGGHHYYTRIANNGRLFTQTVLAATQSAFITVGDACGLLRVKANHLRELAAYAGVGMDLAV